MRLKPQTPARSTSSIGTAQLGRISVTTAHKIIRRAGLKEWPKTFTNMRSSRAIELVAEYPSHVVDAWLGNTEEVRKEHYVRVTEDDYARALKQK